MKVYFACTGKTEPRYLCDAGFKDILCSYHYYKEDKETIQYLLSNRASLFADSGAFSAANAGALINLDSYSRWIIEQKIQVFVSLDVIGDASATYVNWKKMKENYVFDIPPVPTFHMGEPKEWLERYLETCDYIALGGMVDSDNIEVWLDKVWTIILKQSPDVKIHGFGMTTTEFVYKYPWYSFDSSSFKAGKRFGRVPFFNGAKLINLDYDRVRHDYNKEHPEDKIFEDNALAYKVTDCIGAKAYTDLVAYLNKFPKRNDFLKQTSLFPE